MRWEGVPARHSDAKMRDGMSRQKMYRCVRDEYLTLWEQRVFIAPSVGPRSPRWADQNWPNKGTARFYVRSGAPHVVPFLVVLCEE